jgi:hypothetical protein
VEHRRHVEPDAGDREELCPELAGENQVTDDAVAGDVVEANDGVEEGTGDHHPDVRVRQQNDVGHLREPVDHGEDHQLAVDTRQPLDEVHGQIGPHRARQV